jgi:hypothetical protein
MKKINVTNFYLILSITILSSIFIFSILLITVGESRAEDEGEGYANKSECREGGPGGDIKVDETDWLGRPTGKRIFAPSETYTICGKCSNASYKCVNYSCHKLSGYVEENGEVVGYRYGIYTHLKLGSCTTTNSKKDKCTKCRLKGTKAPTRPACHTEKIYWVKLNSSCSGDQCCNRLRTDVKSKGTFYNYSNSSIDNCISKE